MAYHNRQLFLPTFAPRGFSYAVRRPNHYPEGVLSIEDRGDSDLPVRTPVVGCFVIPFFVRR